MGPKIVMKIQNNVSQYLLRYKLVMDKKITALCLFRYPSSV